MIDRSILQQCPVFREANPEATRALLLGGTVVRYRAATVLWTAGAPCQGLHVVLSGNVRVLGWQDSRNHVVHVEGAGAQLGQVSVFDNGPMPATAIAATDVTCVRFTAEAVKAAIIADSEIALQLLTGFAGRIRALVKRLSDRTSRAVVTRLADYLLERHAAAGGGEFSLGASQQAVAEELGTVREVVVRGLRALKAAGFLEAAGPRRFRINVDASRDAGAAARSVLRATRRKFDA